MHLQTTWVFSIFLPPSQLYVPKSGSNPVFFNPEYYSLHYPFDLLLLWKSLQTTNNTVMLIMNKQNEDMLLPFKSALMLKMFTLLKWLNHVIDLRVHLKLNIK